MPDFARPWALLLVIPLLALVWRRLSSPTPPLMQALPLGWIGEKKRLLLPPLPWGFRMTGILVLVVALADPGSSTPLTQPKGEGVAIMVAMDISGSMETMDSEGRSRLEVAKEEVARFVEARPGDVVGLVTFGEEAQTRVPPTTHHTHLLESVSRLRVAREENGTALGTGLGLAVQRISTVSSPSRVAVLLTDGRNNTGAMEPEAVARAARDLEVRVHVVGLGGEGGEDPLDEVGLKEIARLTGGRFFRALDPHGFREVMDAVDALERGPTPGEVTMAHHSFHRFFLLLGVLLLATESLLWLVPGRRIR